MNRHRWITVLLSPMLLCLLSLGCGPQTLRLKSVGFATPGGLGNLVSGREIHLTNTSSYDMTDIDLMVTLTPPIDAANVTQKSKFFPRWKPNEIVVIEGFPPMWDNGTKIAIQGKAKCGDDTVEIDFTDSITMHH